MTIREEQAHEAASLYYLQGQTMETIARRMDISRSSVSRILGYAREVGLVRISIAPPPGSQTSLAARLYQAFGVNAWVVPVRSADTDLQRLQDVSHVAAERLIDLLEPASTLGIAWGNTTSAIAERLPRVNIPAMTVVQLNGAANPLDTGMDYASGIFSQAAEALGAKTVDFPVPAFFDFPETKAALWRERSIRRVLEVIDSCDVVLFGVGALDASLPSHVYSGGFLDAEELERVRRDGVVGDVCTVLLREDGSSDMDLNARASGPTPAQLKKVPRRLCAAAGNSKVKPLVGALRSGVVTDLVVDSALASLALERVSGAESQV